MNLGNVVGLIVSDTEPEKTYVIWAKTVSDVVVGHYTYLDGGWKKLILDPTTAEGSIIYKNAAGDLVELLIGDEGLVVCSQSGVPVWDTGGLTGPAGDAGDRGSGIKVAAGAPSVVGGEIENDVHINTTDGEIWKFHTSAWVDTGVTIKGAAGADGNDGNDGDDGLPGAGYIGTSITSIDLSTVILNPASPPPVTMTFTAGLAYIAGSYVRIISTVDATKYFEGLVTSYNISTGVIIVGVYDKTSTSVIASWSISIAGYGISSGDLIFKPTGTYSGFTVLDGSSTPTAGTCPAPPAGYSWYKKI